MATRTSATMPSEEAHDDIFPTIAAFFLFLADLALILVFPIEVIAGLIQDKQVPVIFSEFVSNPDKPIQTSILILVIYLIAYGFLYFGRDHRVVNVFAGIFIYAYASLSALFLGISSSFLIQGGSAPDEAYLGIALTIFVFAVFSIALFPRYKATRYPLMLLFVAVLLSQVVSWVIFFLRHAELPENWVYTENLGLLIYALILAVVFWKLAQRQESAADEHKKATADGQREEKPA